MFRIHAECSALGRIRIIWLATLEDECVTSRVFVWARAVTELVTVAAHQAFDPREPWYDFLGWPHPPPKLKFPRSVD